jgi:hypothetical protein
VRKNNLPLFRRYLEPAPSPWGRPIRSREPDLSEAIIKQCISQSTVSHTAETINTVSLVRWVKVKTQPCGQGACCGPITYHRHLMPMMPMMTKHKLCVTCSNRAAPKRLNTESMVDL